MLLLLQTGEDVMAQEPKHIVVVGTSAGGLSALNELVSQFDTAWDAAFFIVLHLSRKGISDFLRHRLQHYTKLNAVLAQDGLPIERGNIYIAPPGNHLLVKKGVVKLGHGPEENRWRPSIDVLFRSAAAAYNSQVTGLVLTGLLDDGTAGMWAIKRSGGTAIVQDPNEAEYPDMPLSVLNRMEVDHCLTLNEMGPALANLFATKQITNTPVPEDVKAEAAIAEKMASGPETLTPLGTQSVYGCPDCGGILFEIKDEKILRFRCQIGHSYNEEDLEIKQVENIENTLWVALRMMEERKNLITKIEGQTRARGYHRYADEHKQKGDELQVHINKLKELLYSTQQISK